MRPWLKVRTHLARTMKVRQIARYVGLSDPRHAVGLIEEAWAMFMEDSHDGVLAGVGQNAADARAFLAEAWDCPHLPAAMEAVGWLQITADGDAVMPGFRRWITSSDDLEERAAQQRERERLKKGRQRARKRKAAPEAHGAPCPRGQSPGTSPGDPSYLLSSSLGCSSTKDSQSGVPAAPPGANAGSGAGTSPQVPSDGPPAGTSPRVPSSGASVRAAGVRWPKSLDTLEVREAWDAWVERRDAKHPGDPLDAITVEQSTLKRLLGWGVEGALDALRAATEGGWKSLQPPKVAARSQGSTGGFGGRRFEDAWTPPPVDEAKHRALMDELFGGLGR